MEGANANFLVMLVDIKNTEQPGTELSDDGGQGHTYHTPGEHNDKHQIQHDINHTGNGQKQQRGTAVAQSLQNTGIHIVPQVAHNPGKDHHHIGAGHTIGIFRHIHHAQQRPC